jgi:hypothetical protein
MAKKDSLQLQGLTVPAVNIHFRVGRGGDNGPADVMLIQALFRYISRNDIAARGQLGLSTSQLPEITGTCDAKTMAAIWGFQQKNRRKLLNVDGLIHPASYADRVIKDMTKPIMSISLLHNMAVDTSLMRNDSDYISGLIKLEPKLGPWLA